MSREHAFEGTTIRFTSFTDPMSPSPLAPEARHTYRSGARPMNPLEIAAVVTTLAAVWLTVRQNIWCWPFAIVGVTLYAVVFYQARLYGNMGLQGVFLALSIYGWYAWLRGGDDHGTLHVSRVSRIHGLVLSLLGFALAVGLALLFERWTDAASPRVDSTLTSFSIVAQWMMSRKILENWIVWIAVDVVYVWLFISQSLYLTAGLYVVFLGLATQGFMEWKRSM